MSLVFVHLRRFLGPVSPERCWFGPVAEITCLSSAAGRRSDTEYFCKGVVWVLAQDKNTLAGNCIGISIFSSGCLVTPPK